MGDQDSAGADERQLHSRSAAMCEHEKWTALKRGSFLYGGNEEITSQGMVSMNLGCAAESPSMSRNLLITEVG